MIADPLERAIRRAVRCSAFPGSIQPAAKDRAVLSRLASAARCYARYRPAARSFPHMGKRFRLHQFDGWLIVMTWSGAPVVGPVRVGGGKA